MIRPVTPILGAIVSLALVATAPVAAVHAATPAKKACAKGYVRKSGTCVKRKARKTSAVRQTDASTLAGLRACANRERSKRGLPALKQDAALDRAAQRHAEDMAAKDYFDHQSKDGRSPWKRIAAALLGEKPFGSMGENIAMGYPDADATCDGWMNSPGHRANILRKTFTHIGVGWKDGYAVQDFGGRK